MATKINKNQRTIFLFLLLWNAAMPHLESKTKLIMTASVNRYINPYFNENLGSPVAQFETNQLVLTEYQAIKKVSHWLTNSYTKNNKNYFSQQHQQLVSYLSLRFERTIIFTINGKNLAQSKIIHYLCSRILRWREYVLRKAFRKGSFLGRFRTY